MLDANVFNDKSWKQHNKYKIIWKNKKYVLKVETPHFEIIYYIVSSVLDLAHTSIIRCLVTKFNNKYAVLNTWHDNVKHGWYLYENCTNVANMYVFDMLYNDFLMGYSDRSPNCHTVNGRFIPIDQDSGSYTALLPPQKDTVYEKHIMHNMMLNKESRLCNAYQQYRPCSSFIDYASLGDCLTKAFSVFPLHSTKMEHILYRYNESKEFSCSCNL